MKKEKKKKKTKKKKKKEKIFFIYSLHVLAVKKKIQVLAAKKLQVYFNSPFD